MLHRDDSTSNSISVYRTRMSSARRPRRPIARFEIADHSMSPTLQPADYVLTRRPGRRLRRNSIVIIMASDQYLAKRIVGLGDEQVRVVGGVIMIDDLPYEDPNWSGATRPDGEWTVPPDGVFVLGDNRIASSSDSRHVGIVFQSDIVAVVIGRYWPWRRSSAKRRR